MSEKDAAKIGMSWKDWILSCIYGSILVIQIVFTFFNYNCLGFDHLANAVWVVMAV